jgi:hypothetical protein
VVSSSNEYVRRDFPAETYAQAKRHVVSHFWFFDASASSHVLWLSRRLWWKTIRMRSHWNIRYALCVHA